jgi:hypothetical protein
MPSLHKSSIFNAIDRVSRYRPKKEPVAALTLWREAGKINLQNLSSQPLAILS